MKRTVICLALSLSAFALGAQTTRTSLDSLSQTVRNGMSDTVESFKKEAEASLEEYLAFESSLRQEYEEYCQKVKGEWGDSVPVQSSNKVWVEYGDDDSFRTVVDFETGKVTVEVLSDPSDDDAVRKEKIEKAIANLLSSRGRSVGYKSDIADDEPVTVEPVLDGMIDFSRYFPDYRPADNAPTAAALKPSVDKSKYKLDKGKSLSLNRTAVASSAPANGTTMASIAEKKRQEEAERKRIEEENRHQEVARRQEEERRRAEVSQMTELLPEVVAQTVAPQVKPVSTTSGQKNILKIEMELVEDHMPKRAEQFKGLVKQNSEKFTVEQPLIYAIMEQESAFNPVAKSFVPAYGLMQLVPKSGGRDAYRYVHKQDVIPSANFLYVPENNIELGTGYLRLLMTTSFAGVKDSKCRMLCAIAAYNTGAGNVSRAITGNTNVSKAIPQINAMTYDQLFNHLKTHLPHAETRDYIQKVTGKMKKYMAE